MDKTESSPYRCETCKVLKCRYNPKLEHELGTGFSLSSIWHFTSEHGCTEHSDFPQTAPQCNKYGKCTEECDVFWGCSHKATAETIKTILSWMNQLEGYIASPESLEDYQSAWNALKIRIEHLPDKVSSEVLK